MSKSYWRPRKRPGRRSKTEFYNVPEGFLKSIDPRYAKRLIDWYHGKQVMAGLGGNFHG